MYTEQELEEAKAYLRDRMRNQKSMSDDVLRLLELYAGYLLTALFGNASDYDIELLISDLIEQLIADCETLAVDEHDRRDMILAYMHTERGGEDLRGWVGNRAHTFFNEVLAVYTAGRLLNKGYQALLGSITLNMADPWKNSVIVEAREKVANGEVSSDFDFSEPHFGRGVETDSYGALDRMLTYAVADAWTYWQYEDAKDRGARGYYVMRGSSYSCDICDSHTGIFYYIGDDLSRPQYHLNCCCYVVYSYVERI